MNGGRTVLRVSAHHNTQLGGGIRTSGNDLHSRRHHHRKGRHYGKWHRPRISLSIVNRGASHGVEFALLTLDGISDACGDWRRRQGERLVLRLIDVINRVGLGIVAMEVSLRSLGVDWRRDTECERATLARRNAWRNLVHEELVVPAGRKVEQTA